MDTKQRNKLVIQTAVIAILGNSLLFVGKYIAGEQTDSVALIADAWHTLSDSISSLVLLIGMWFAKKPADKEHPFGHGRIELIVTLFIGFLLLLISINFFSESYKKFIHHENIEYSLFAIIITIVSLLVKEGLAQYSFYIGKKSGSAALRADGWHHRSDAITSVIILVGIFLSPYLWWIDVLLGFIVSLIILYTAYDIIKDSVSSIIGEKAGEKMEENIQKICYSTLKKDVHVHHIHIHNYGVHKEMTFHICLPNSTNIEEGHSITDKLEKTIDKELGIIATIHIDPYSTCE
ncbi:MAG: cation diffusion facilitator family transporter [Bacteroidales bacterium]